MNPVNPVKSTMKPHHLVTILGVTPAASFNGSRWMVSFPASIKSQALKGVGTTVIVHVDIQQLDFVNPNSAIATSFNAKQKTFLVDDDDSLAETLTHALTQNGCEILRARDGMDAVILYDPKTVSLVITDMVMPDLGGLVLFAKLRKPHPAVKIIAMSGGGRNNSEVYLPSARYLGAAQTLTKPFTTEQLLAAIAEALAPSDK